MAAGKVVVFSAYRHPSYTGSIAITLELAHDPHGSPAADPALPWVSEVKIHLDSFDPRIQQDAMGIHLGKVQQSLLAVQAQAPVRGVLNHPLRSLELDGK